MRGKVSSTSLKLHSINLMPEIDRRKPIAIDAIKNHEKERERGREKGIRF